MSAMNYYVVLGIAEDADSDAIRRAFRVLARRYHPDAGAGSSTAEFRRVLEAYETLSDPDRRRLYDHDLRSSRVRPMIIAEPAGSRPVAGPLFTSRTVSFDFPNRRVTVTSRDLFDELLDDLFGAMTDDWFRHWR